ncbi:MAG TPA: carbamoyltransferase HypF [Bryobacteraceae bacterium]|jgi:hydrogenase maturation protein HypF
MCERKASGAERGIAIHRLRILLYGAVQGVGFRPFVCRLARELHLNGHVSNNSSGAVVEIEGSDADLTYFQKRLERDRPRACLILAKEITRLEPAEHTSFEIVASDAAAAKTAVVLPDIATCPECLAEIRDPAARRFGYAFTNCTNCGPRYTIIRGIPYDRPNTTMSSFPMCPDCRAEYETVADRRFHAQPIACPVCGPKLEPQIDLIAGWLRQGEIVALKGIGGFQLLCDARSSESVKMLRTRKHREEKPFAVMFPDLDAVVAECFVSPAEETLLRSTAAPIVLLRSRGGQTSLAPEVSLSSPYVGAMLPYSPLHGLLLEQCRFPVVATSGNLSDEPIAIDNEDARERLGRIADRFAWHDRPIVRPCDDSVARIQNGREIVMRRARGYAPLPVRVRRPLRKVLALGAHLKNTVAIAIERHVFLSQHVGDLETLAAFQAFQHAIEDLRTLYEFEPELIACDLHPDYASTKHADTFDLPIVRIQHHMAHVAACAAENDIEGPYLGVAWDGTGYGADGVIWGSEFFAVDGGSYRRVAHLRPFQLPGGESAIRDCRKTALSLLHAAGLDSRLSNLPEKDAAVLLKITERNLNSPWTTSMGRLLDAAAALSGVASRNGFEGQVPMKFEAAIAPSDSGAYPACIDDAELDWRPAITALVDDVQRHQSPGNMARRFHNTLIEWIAGVAKQTALDRVVLSGGVFQNSYLAEKTFERLTAIGHRVYTHQRVPPNDGGIALGQAVIAGALG